MLLQNLLLLGLLLLDSLSLLSLGSYSALSRVDINHGIVLAEDQHLLLLERRQPLLLIHLDDPTFTFASLSKSPN